MNKTYKYRVILGLALILLLTTLLSACQSTNVAQTPTPPPVNTPTLIPEPTEAIATMVPETEVTETAATETAATEPAQPGAPVVDAPGLLDKTWQWTGYEDSAGENNLNIENPENYTLEFMADGTYEIIADCNSGSGTFTAQGGSIVINPGIMTLKLCTEGSQDTVFLNRLNDVVTYVIQDGVLYLNLKMDAGNMVFKAQ